MALPWFDKLTMRVYFRKILDLILSPSKDEAKISFFFLQPDEVETCVATIPHSAAWIKGTSAITPAALAPRRGWTWPHIHPRRARLLGLAHLAGLRDKRRDPVLRVRVR